MTKLKTIETSWNTTKRQRRIADGGKSPGEKPASSLERLDGTRRCVASSSSLRMLFLARRPVHDVRCTKSRTRNGKSDRGQVALDSTREQVI